MDVDTGLSSFFAATVVGLLLSVVIEGLMRPRLPLMRPWPAWALHAGLWLLAHALLTLVLGRPWFAAVAVMAFLLMLVLVNNAKFKALREPFVFQDYEYFTDAIRHPRLYIPFLGWRKFIAAASIFIVVVAIGFWGEDAPAERFAWPGQIADIVTAGVGGALLMLWASRKKLTVGFDPLADVQRLGLLASLWRYAQEKRVTPTIASPFSTVAAKAPSTSLPNLVAVQSESFFDARTLYTGIRPQVLAEFDRLRANAIGHGKLKVPAWGANTVRTEFAFLSGIGDDLMGAHRFNPYRAIAGGWAPQSLASFLKRLGYRTICIHPYPASFYLRDRVYPRLGFDEFIDIRAFNHADRFGPYIGDAAVAEKVAAILQEAISPVFIFAITMENHGPLHLERVAPKDIDALYSVAPPEGCDDLTVYLRHLRNGDAMVASLRATLERCDRPAALCWFGDHVPILPAVYQQFGAPEGDVEYVFWSNQKAGAVTGRNLSAENLSSEWLRAAGVMD